MDCIELNSPGQNTGMGSHTHSRGSSQPRVQTQVFHAAGRFFTSWATRETFKGKHTIRLHFLGSLVLTWGPMTDFWPIGCRQKKNTSSSLVPKSFMLAEWGGPLGAQRRIGLWARRSPRRWPSARVTCLQRTYSMSEKYIFWLSHWDFRAVVTAVNLLWLIHQKNEVRD